MIGEMDPTFFPALSLFSAWHFLDEPVLILFVLLMLNSATELISGGTFPTDTRKKKILLLKGKEKEIPHVS